MKSLVFRSLLLLALFSFAGCSTVPKVSTGPVSVAATNPEVKYSGRYEVFEGGRVAVGFSGARSRLRFEGSSIAVRMSGDSSDNYFQAWVDGRSVGKFKLSEVSKLYPLAASLSGGEHVVEVTRITECYLGQLYFEGFEIGGSGKVLSWGQESSRKIEFIGDSITCGYGVEANDASLPFEASTENFCESYSALTARALNADYLVVSRSGIGMVRGYDGPYEGSEESMPTVYPYSFYQDSEYKWDFNRFTPDVVCINLGTNDFSTTGVNVEKYVGAYVAFASEVLERYPASQLVLLEGPMNNSEELGQALARVLKALREKAPDRVSFLELSPQGSVGYGASWHPNQAQSKINAKELIAYLRDLMDWR